MAQRTCEIDGCGKAFRARGLCQMHYKRAGYRRCAYCDQRVEGQPDPDHVVPLSRGGSNSITNILPSCRACNSDKRDLLLAEWRMDRQRRCLPARRTDPAQWIHLTEALIAA